MDRFSAKAQEFECSLKQHPLKLQLEESFPCLCIPFLSMHLPLHQHKHWCDHTVSRIREFRLDENEPRMLRTQTNSLSVPTDAVLA